MSNEYENFQQLEYPKVYDDENKTIPYSPRGQFGFMNPTDTSLAYPKVYDDENKTIPYSPRGQFGFMNPTDTANGTAITLESMKNMSIDQIVELYKNGYRIENTFPTHQIATAQDGISISSGAILLIGMGLLAYTLLKR